MYLLIFMFAVPKQTCNANDTDCNETICPIPDVANAKVKGNIYTVGSKAKAICHPGYGMKTGSSIFICNETGDWLDMPSCIPVCPAPPIATSATVLTSITPAFEGDTVNYICKPEFATAGQENMTATCQANGTWSDLLFQCQKACHTPGIILNATRVIGEAVVGTSRMYSCNKNFITTDGTKNFTRTCQENRTWTDPPVYCLKDCGEPPTLENATCLAGNTYETTERAYDCHTGYIATNDKHNFTVTCQGDGEWTTPGFICLKDCLTPWMSGAVSEFSHTFEGSVAILECGYSRVFENNNDVRITNQTITVTCVNGTWEGMDLVHCEFECPESTASYNKIVLRHVAFCLHQLQYEDARKACGRFGSLVKIYSTHTRVPNHIPDNTLTNNSYRKDFWIQGHRKQNAEGYEYDNKSTINFLGDISNWQFDCIYLDSISNTFGDKNCTERCYYICAMP